MPELPRPPAAPEPPGMEARRPPEPEGRMPEAPAPAGERREPPLLPPAMGPPAPEPQTLMERMRGMITQSAEQVEKLRADKGLDRPEAFDDDDSN
eukprot:1225560-Rhodomonas_salina.1